MGREDKLIPKFTETEITLKLNPPRMLKQLRSFMAELNNFDLNEASLVVKLRPLLKKNHKKN